jgi:hypothetical protein
MVLSVLVGLPGRVSAQEVSLAGKVTDSTDAVLPGVTITALHVDSGNTFVAVTDASGEYRINALRPGVYTLTAELTGFTTVMRDRFELLVGQRAVLNLKMTLSTVEESITVKGDAPLIDATQSKMGGNIDSRQLEALPLNGRNYLQLSMLAPGSRMNAVDDTPFVNQWPGTFQMNLDGQQITNTQTLTGYAPQPRFSRDAIAEFQLISSRADATQGRSLGNVVNVVTKSGTNTPAGTVSGYFRDDKFNAEDFIVHRVLPYSDQQISLTFGGPIRKDKTHFFGYYEGERQPVSVTFTSPFPRFNIPDLNVTEKDQLAGVRFDNQFSANTRLSVRGNGWLENQPIVTARLPGATLHPSALQSQKQVTGEVFMSLTHTGHMTVNELKAGYNIGHGDYNAISNPGSVGNLSNMYEPIIKLQGYTIGGGGIWWGREYQNTYQLRDDVTQIRGHHELKVGAELLIPQNFIYYGVNNDDVIIADLGPIPANIQDLFPVWNDPRTWNIAALSPITRQVQHYVGTFNVHCYLSGPSCHRTKPQTGAWFQDNWQATGQLTLNLGIRWDFAKDSLANDANFAPIRGPQPQEWTLFAPRLGFAYALAESKTVIRGGFGKYYAGAIDSWTHTSEITLDSVAPTVFNDGRPNFAADPFNLAGGGHIPTLAEAKHLNPDITVVYGKTPYSYQTSIGLQRQIGQTMSFQADYVWTGGRREDVSNQINVSYNPATGVDYPYSDLSKRPFPDLGRVSLRNMSGRSNYHGLETGFTKRLSARWQSSATYTLSGSWNDSPPTPLIPGCAYPMNGLTMTCNTPLTVAQDLGGEYGLGATVNSIDQRHRAVFNGIWQLPYQLQLSGLYFFGSGLRYATTYGGDIRDSGGYASRLRPNGTIVPRNNFVGLPVHRVDVRLQKRLPLGLVKVDGMLEVFNLFNHQNYGGYVTTEASKAYGQPVQNLNVAYQPRTMQLGFRVTF